LDHCNFRERVSAKTDVFKLQLRPQTDKSVGKRLHTKVSKRFDSLKSSVTTVNNDKPWIRTAAEYDKRRAMPWRGSN
jgi:hypothetical protein